MTDKMMIKRYKKRALFLLTTVMLLLFSIVKADIIYQSSIDDKLDIIYTKTLTIEELNLQVENLSNILDDKIKEVKILEKKLTSLQKILDEKRIRYNMAIIDTLSISTGPNGKIIKIGD